MRCLNCGDAFDGTKKVCHVCGTKVIDDIPAVTVKETAQAEEILPTKKKSKKIKEK